MSSSESLRPLPFFVLGDAVPHPILLRMVLTLTDAVVAALVGQPRVHRTVLRDDGLRGGARRWTPCARLRRAHQGQVLVAPRRGWRRPRRPERCDHGRGHTGCRGRSGRELSRTGHDGPRYSLYRRRSARLRDRDRGRGRACWRRGRRRLRRDPGGRGWRRLVEGGGDLGELLGLFARRPQPGNGRDGCRTEGRGERSAPARRIVTPHRHGRRGRRRGVGGDGATRRR